MSEFFSVFLNSTVFQGVLLWVTRLWFLWLPLLAAYLFWNTWFNQRTLRILKTFSWTLLEIRVPRDVAKSPRALEAVLAPLYNAAGTGGFLKRIFKEFFSAGPSGLVERVFKGFLPFWYSLEIASINGNVRFYIRCLKSFRNIVESQVYAQYPDAEIVEADDYTYAGNFDDLEEWNVWGGEFGLAMPDAYPIRTYVDFGLHETQPKEEQKVNPLASFLEHLGSMRDGEQIWFQVLIKGAGKKWVEDGKKVIDQLMGRDKPPEEGKPGKNLSKGEHEVIASIEKNIAKMGFETGIRVLYIARRDIFNAVNAAAVVGLINQYNTQNLNGFKVVNSTSAGFLYKKKRETAKKKTMIDAYRKRGYFYPPYKRKSFVFNTEELATIYHFPGRVAETPTFGRVESKKGEPPSTLPV